MKHARLFVALILCLLAGGLSSLVRAQDEAAPAKPKSGKSQGTIAEVKLAERLMTVEFVSKTNTYKVAEDASIKTLDKDGATLEDLQVGKRINFWFTVQEDGTNIVHRIIPKEGTKKPAEEKPAE